MRPHHIDSRQRVREMYDELEAERDRLREALEATYLDSIDPTIADDEFRETAGKRARFYVGPEVSE